MSKEQNFTLSQQTLQLGGLAQESAPPVHSLSADRAETLLQIILGLPIEVQELLFFGIVLRGSVGYRYMIASILQRLFSNPPTTGENAEHRVMCCLTEALNILDEGKE